MSGILPLAPPRSGRGADRGQYDALMNVLRGRCTGRLFDRNYIMPRAHTEMVLDAAACAPSGANAQPWHYVVVTNAQTKQAIARRLTAEQQRRAELAGRARATDYTAMGHAPGFIVVVLDPRMTWAFPGLMEGSELDQPYHANSERVLLQSIAASTMAAHLAAASLGYHTWWISALGYDEGNAVIARELGIPSDLRITDFLLFGPCLLPPAPRRKKARAQIASWDRFDMANFRTVEQIDEWMGELRQDALEAPETKRLR